MSNLDAQQHDARTAPGAETVERAAAARGQHEKRTGKAHPERPDRHAEHTVEQPGRELPL